VIERARTLLCDLERGGSGGGGGAGKVRPRREPEPQLALFEPAPHPVLARMRGVDVNQLSPVQALVLLAELTEQARS
jgi:hypothetical protein